MAAVLVPWRAMMAAFRVSPVELCHLGPQALPWLCSLASWLGSHPPPPPRAHASGLSCLPLWGAALVRSLAGPGEA